MRRALPALLLSLCGLLLPGLGVGALVLYLAWQHNPQGEFHGEPGGPIHWHAWLTVGAGWFLVTTAVVAVGALCWTHLARLFHR